MFVGVLRLSFRIPGSRSLKDRRRVVRSFKDRLQARLRLSVAEVGALDDHQGAVIGVAVVANDPARCDELLASAAAMAATLPDAVLVDRATEIVPFGPEGRGVRGEEPWRGATGQRAEGAQPFDEEDEP
jgi:uncharacterized protein YlxP (DUF503 family)